MTELKYIENGTGDDRVQLGELDEQTGNHI